MKAVTKPNLFFSADGVNSVTNSSAFDVTYLDSVSIQVIWSNGSGSPAGNIEVDATLDGTTWTNITLSPVPAVSGNSGSALIQLSNVAYDKIRCRWQRSAGTIDLDMYMMAKSQGR